jgi:hypothetical protein
MKCDSALLFVSTKLMGKSIGGGGAASVVSSPLS